MNNSSPVCSESCPFVSVIVPVYNAAQHIRSCIEALLAQTYPRERYELLIVDNGSTDATREVVQGYPVTLLTEDQIQGSYAARNRGLQDARGDVIAFTDSDCTPVSGWIKEGVRALRLHSADVVGGNVRFVLSPRRTGAELWDSLTNMQIEQNVKERKVAKTANLFVRAAVVERIGPFPDDVQSGGDVIWTRRATRDGFKLAYASSAEVAHPARKLGRLLRKQYRVGKGQAVIRSAEGLSWRDVREIARSFFPPSPLSIQRLLQDRLGISGRQRLWGVWLAAWLANMATGLGNVAGLARFWKGEG